MLKKLAIFGLLLALLLMLWVMAAFAPEKSATENRKIVGVVTGLPLLWPEGDVDDLVRDGIARSAAYERLSVRYRLSATDIFNLSEQDETLLLVQPGAISPEGFVILDEWVRAGGHALIFADPALQWESIYPLGDPRRPPYTSLLSPLLRHWGVELLMPVDAGAGMKLYDIAGRHIRSRTVGIWQSVDGAGTSRGEAGDICRIMDDGILADCQVGKGRATLVADADMFDGNYWRGSGLRRITGNDDYDNMAYVEDLIG